MTSFFRKKNRTLTQILFIAVVLELILCGSGHLISFKGISLRLILLLFIFISELLFCDRWVITNNKSNKVLVLLMSYFFINFMVSFFVNDKKNAINELTGYLPILSSPFFIGYFNLYDDEKFFKKLFEYSTFCLSIIAILIWIYCFIGGIGVGNEFISRFLSPYDYGVLSYIGIIPRLFLKGSIFICIGFVFVLSDILDDKLNLKKCISLLIHFIAIITTFTVGLYVATLVAVLFYYIFSPKRYRAKKWLIFSFALILLIFALFRFNIIGIMSQRFTGTYNFNYKGTQFKILFETWKQHPIFGTGFGKSVLINYGYTTGYTYSWEVMWMQVLVHTGLVGFTLFVSYIAITVFELFRKYFLYQDRDYFLYAIAVLILCFESFSNPFMNNAIGLLLFSICTGIACSNGKKLEEKG